jgi:hypothetical protein
MDLHGFPGRKGFTRDGVDIEHLTGCGASIGRFPICPIILRGEKLVRR